MTRPQYTSALNVRAAILKIKQEWPVGPIEALHFAIVEQAINDLASDYKQGSTRDNYTRWCKSTAKEYLMGPIYHAQYCGIKSSWIRYVLTKCEVL